MPVETTDVQGRTVTHLLPLTWHAPGDDPDEHELSIDCWCDPYFVTAAGWCHRDDPPRWLH